MKALYISLDILHYRSPRFLLLVIISVISCHASYCDGACHIFRCGNFTLDYPFGRKNSGCGDPALQVDCDYEVETPLLNIGGRQYYITEVISMEWYANRTMNILAKDLAVGECDLSGNIYGQFFKRSTQFHVADGYSNLTLGKACVYANISELYTIVCKEQKYYNFISPDSSVVCDSIFEVPVNAAPIELGKEPADQIKEGLKITWSATKYCEDCETGNRNCDSHKTPSFCYCRGVSYLDKCSNGKSRIAKILGASIGTVVLFLVAVLLVFVYRKRLPSSAKLQLRMPVKKVEKFLQDYIHHQMPARYSYSQLKKITNNFADLLGEGGFGAVYKGMLPSDKLVAVKILNQSKQTEKQFMNEVATLGTVHHVHLVRLMGYCFERSKSALVYEYMANKSLEKFIFTGRDREQILNWEQLYSISLGAARGIAYLHNECRSRIIHFDIKPHNILLDEGLTAKVADFGLAKLCGREDDHITMTAVKGTPGYTAPEVWSKNLGPVTEKSDCYSFGMVLLEMVGGRNNIDLHASRTSQVYFPEWAFKMLENGQIETLLRGRGNRGIRLGDEEKARRMTKVGLWCIQYNSTERPSMSRVVQMLEGNGDDVGDPPLPFHSSPPRQPASASSTEEASLNV